MKKYGRYGKHVWVIGLLLALTGAYLMFDGQILGANTTGIATVVGIVGLFLIATSGTTLGQVVKKKR